MYIEGIKIDNEETRLINTDFIESVWKDTNDIYYPYRPRIKMINGEEYHISKYTYNVLVQMLMEEEK